MKIMNLCITVFLLATQSVTGTIETITESKKPKAPKKYSPAWDMQSSIRSAARSVKHAAILFGLGVYVGKSKPELVDQVLADGQKIAHDSYNAISKKVSSGVKNLRELIIGNQSSSIDEKGQAQDALAEPETSQEEDQSEGGKDNERQD
jgi:hypothetical protein